MNATEIDRLMVTLVGDDSGFEQIMAEFEGDVEAAVKLMEQAAREALAAQNAAMQEAARITKAAATPLELYTEEVKSLDEHLGAGRITQETYNRTIEKLQKTLPEYQQAQEDAAKAVKEAEKAQAAENARLAEAANIFRSVRTPIEAYDAEVKVLDEHLKAGRISQDTYNRAVDKLGKELPEARAAQEQLNADLKTAEMLYKGTRTDAEKYAQEVQELNRLLREGHIDAEVYARAIKKIDEHYKVVDTSLVDFNRNLGQAGQMIQSAGQTITNVGHKMTVGITAPIIAAGAAAVYTGNQFEQAMADLSAAANPTAAEFKQIEDAALALSESLKVVRPTPVVEGFTELLKAGVPVEQVLNGVGKAAIEFARVGELETSTAATVMADALNVFQEDATKTVNILSSAADASSISIAQIAEAFSQVSAVAKASNQDLRDTAAAIAVLGNAGVKGSDAGTSLKTMFQKLKAPVDKAAEAMAAIGLEVRNEEGQMKSMRDLIGELEVKLGALDQTARDNAIQDIFGTDASRAAEIFIDKGVAGFDAMTVSMEGALTVSEKFMMQAKTGEGVWLTFLASLDRMWIQIDKTVGAAFDTILGYLTQAIDFTAKWIENNPQLAEMAAIALAIATAIGPVVTVIGMAVTAVGGLIVGITGFIAVGWEVVAIAAAIVAGIALVVGAVVSVGVAIGALVYQIIGPEGIQAAWDTATKATYEFVTKAAGFIYNFRDNVKAIFEWLPQNWHLVIIDLQTAWLTLFMNMTNNAQVGFRTIVRLLTAFQGWAFNLWRQIFTIEFVKAVIDGVTKVASIFHKFAAKSFEVLKGIFTGKKISMADFIEQLGKDFEAGAKNSNFFETATDILKEESKNFKMPLDGFESSIKDGPKLAFDFGKQTADAFSEGLQMPDEIANMDAALNEAFSDKNTKAIDEMKEKEAALSKETQKLIDKMREEAATVGMNEHQKRVWRLEQENAPPAIIAEAKALEQKLTAMEADKKATEKAAQLMKKFQNDAEKYATPAEKFNSTQKELNDLLTKGLISVEAFDKGIRDAQKELNKEVNIKFKVTGIDAVEAGTAEAARRIEEFRRLATNVPVGVAAAGGARADGFAPVRNAETEKNMERIQKADEISTKDQSDLLKKIEENTRPRNDDPLLDDSSIKVEFEALNL